MTLSHFKSVTRARSSNRAMGETNQTYSRGKYMLHTCQRNCKKKTESARQNEDHLRSWSMNGCGVLLFQFSLHFLSRMHIF